MVTSLKRKRLLCFPAVALSMYVMSPVPSWSLHTGGNVDMRDANGALVTVSGKPYSPKMTCGSPTSTCHLGGVGGHNYESNVSFAVKDQIRRNGTTSSYTVPFPEHGVTAGYHFQMGRNVDWSTPQRNYYHVASFTGSPGMYGKY